MRLFFAISFLTFAIGESMRADPREFAPEIGRLAANARICRLVSWRIQALAKLHVENRSFGPNATSMPMCRPYLRASS
jgi:hypothetical protein